jgi:alkanesulfonate monooxygenase SsuD/methylene tetrahydromethanopterin reductase-like flavin-dependent oxidoreductase (luciferase family)
MAGMEFRDLEYPRLVHPESLVQRAKMCDAALSANRKRAESDEIYLDRRAEDALAAAWRVVKKVSRSVFLGTDLIKAQRLLDEVDAALNDQRTHMREVQERRRAREEQYDEERRNPPQSTPQPPPRHPYPSLENMERDYRRRMDHWNVPGEGM